MRLTVSAVLWSSVLGVGVAGVLGGAGNLGNPAEGPELRAPASACDPEAWDRGLAFIELHTFSALPPEHQALIAAAGQAPASAADRPFPGADLPRLGDEAFATVRRVVDREVWDRMLPVHQRMLVHMVEQRACGEDVPAMCFGPGTDPEVMEAFNRVSFGGVGVRFQQASRWSSTATQGGGLTQGTPTILTYSFVPDGTPCPNNRGAVLSSDLFTFLNGIYGSPSVWQPLYQQVFERWSQLCGVDYVFEPNDDGVQVATQPGVLGVRGDLRMAGTAIDGPSNVLAFNYFPNNGDMVIDTADTFYSSVFGNSLRLRNVLAHEHGHGLGMAHVCPSNQTKLMEPFISVAYDGPQFDDIINGQRHYGDPNEPNDDTASATEIAPATAAAQTVRLVSCDDASDVDVYRLNLPAAGLLSVTVRPVGSIYLEGPQVEACSQSGAPYDALRANDLRVELLAADGTTILDSSSAFGAGVAESVYTAASAPGDVYIRVVPGAAPTVQAYEIDYRLQTTPALELVLPAGVPSTVNPNAPTTFPVRIVTFNETIVPGSARLFYRLSPTGSFIGVPLTHEAGEFYTARLPAPGCSGQPQFYIQVSGQSAGSKSQPAVAPSTVFAPTAQTTTYIIRDTFEAPGGFTVGPGDTATSGAWVRVDPNGTIAQPEDDTTPDGTHCYVTGQAARGADAGAADVDGGYTTLNSPVIDLTNLPADPVLAYSRWYSNNAGASPNADVFTVQFSTDGGQTWNNLEVVGPSGPGTSGGWIRQEFNLATRIPLTSTVRFRFIAEDAGSGSLIEAAVDDFEVRYTTCRESCRGDHNGDGAHTVQDVFDFLAAYFSGSPAADVNGDGEASLEDIFLFVAAWFGPCP